MGELAKAIISTLVYFDIFDYPLTLDELHLYLLKYRATKEKIEKEIDKLKNLIDFKDGHYFLKGRDEILEIHKKREKLSEKKWDWTKKAMRWLQLAPFTRMIGVTSSLAINNAKEESDIDLFVIAKKNRLYTSRLFCFLILSLFNLFNKIKRLNNRFCLGYFITEEELDMSSRLISEVLNGNLYPLYGVSTLVFYLDRASYQNFITKNKWIYEFLPNFSFEKKEQIFGSKWCKESKYLGTIREIFEFFLKGFGGDLMEKILFKIQKRRALRFIKQYPEAEYILNQKMFRIFCHKNSLKKFRENLDHYLSTIK